MGGWANIPDKYKPHWSTWNIAGTPFEESQRRLKAKGLSDPWVRNEVWIYKIPKEKYSIGKIMSRGMLPGFALFVGALAVEKVFFGGNFFASDPAYSHSHH